MGCQQSKVKDSKHVTTAPYFKQASGVVVPAEDAPIITAAAAAPVADILPTRRSLSQQRDPMGITVVAKSCSPDRLAATTIRYDAMEQTCCRPDEYQGGFEDTITMRRPSPSPAPADDEVVVPQVVEQPVPTSKPTSRQPSQQPVISREESRQPGEPQPREPSRPSAKSSVAREPSAQPAAREMSQSQISLIEQPQAETEEIQQEEHQKSTTPVSNDSVLVAKSDLMQLALAVAAAEVKEARRRMRREKRRATLATHHAATATRLSGSLAEDMRDGSIRSRKSVAFTREVLESTIPECCQPQKKNMRRSMGRKDKDNTIEPTPLVEDNEEDMWCDMSFEAEEENAQDSNKAIMSDTTTEVFPRLSGLLEQAVRASAEHKEEGEVAQQPLQQQKVNTNNASSANKGKGAKRKGEDFVYNANSDTLNAFGKKSNRRKGTRKDENSGVHQTRRNRRPHSHVGKTLHLHSNVSEEKYQEMANAFARLLTDIQTFDAQMAS